MLSSSVDIQTFQGLSFINKCWSILFCLLFALPSSETCCKVCNGQGSVGGLLKIFFFLTGCFCVIILAQDKEMYLRGYTVITGYSRCPPCLAQYAKLAHASDSEYVSTCEEGDVQAIEQDVSIESTHTSLHSTLQDLDLSPLKLQFCTTF